MHILFLSANDFKDKSIQVIRKTPEAYVEAGHKVTYIVSRDRSKSGNYYYEDEINPNGVKVIRFTMPLNRLRDLFSSGIFQTILTQIAAYFSIFKLSIKAARFIKNNKVDVIYGYETQGVCAIRCLRFFGQLNKGIKVVSRFQGSWIPKYLKEKNYLKLILNFDDILALKSKADLYIMTDDGTEGNYALEKLNKNLNNNLKFWINGVDEMKLPESEYDDLLRKYRDSENLFILCSISRLEPWKKVDRIIYLVEKLVKEYDIKNLLYLIIGQGNLSDEYRNLVKKLNLEENIVFCGAIPNVEVKKYMNVSDAFASTYNLSNVGNPLLEAIRANKIIFTLNNGTTSDWIKHRKNGFIYNISENLIDDMAKDMANLIEDKNLQEKIIAGIKKTEEEKLWTWQERFNAELKSVELLVENYED